MKLFKIGALAMLSVAFVAVSSCSKYEEGSKFTLLSKKARVVGEWNISNISVNGTSQDLSGYTYSYEFKKDDTFTASVSFGSTTFTDSGTWEFSDDKLRLIITDSDGDISDAEILRLASKEMKIIDVNGSDTTITTFTAQ
ncbi:MAG: lipocalin family protein [Bacteroidota bacterium]